MAQDAYRRGFLLHTLINSGRMLSALGLACFALGAPSASSAQSLPGGSYSHTCNDIQMVSGVLEASCQRADGTWAAAAMPNPGACQNGVVNSNGALACASAPAVTTSQISAGRTTLTNPCNNQDAVYGIATNNSVSNGLVVFVKPGQSVDIVVTQGSSYVSKCGGIPTDTSHFQYFNIIPLS